MASQPLVEAIQLAKEGKKKEARLLFMEIIKRDPHDVMAYLWLVDLVPGSREKMELLERCLLFNPESIMARDALEVVTEQQEPEPDDYQLPRASMAQYLQEKEPKKKSWGKRILRLTLWTLFLFVAAIAIYTGFMLLPGLLAGETNAQTAISGDVMAATWTPLPTATPTITPTPTPELPLPFGMATPPPAAVISVWDIPQLTAFSTWGEGTPLLVDMVAEDTLVVVTTRSVDGFRLSSGERFFHYAMKTPIHLADICPAEQAVVVQTLAGSLMKVSLGNQTTETAAITGVSRLNHLAVSPDCSLVVGIDADDRTTVWQWGSGSVQFQLGNQYSDIRSAAFSPDSETLVLANSWGLAYLFNARSGVEEGKLFDQEGSIDTLAFSDDGSRLAMGGTTTDVVIWDVNDQSVIRSLPEMTAPVTALAFAEENDYLALGLNNGDIFVWDESERRILGQYARHHAAVVSLAFGDTGDTLVSSAQDGAVLQWSIDENQGSDSYHFPAVNSIYTGAVSPNGQLLAMAGAYPIIEIYDLASQANVASLQAHLSSVFSLTFSPDGKQLLSGGFDRKVRLWSMENYELIAVLGEHGDRVRSVAFSHDGTRAASVADDEMIKVWDISSRTELFTLAGHTQPVRSVDFSEDDSELMTVSLDGSIRIWDLQTGQQRSVQGNENEIVYYSGLFRDDAVVFAGNDQGQIEVWDTAKNQLVKVMTGHSGEVRSMAITSDNAILVTGTDTNEIILWDADAYERIRVLDDHQSAVVSVAFTQSGREFVSLDLSGRANVWDLRGLMPPQVLHQYPPRVQSGAMSEALPLAAFAGVDRSLMVVELAKGSLRYHIKGLPANANLLAFSPGGNHLAGALEDGTLMLWDMATGTETLSISSNRRITALGFEPDGRVMLAARSDHIIERLDPASGELLNELVGHSAAVDAMSMANNGVTMASGSADGAILVWDLDTGNVLLRINAYNQPVSGLQFSGDGQQLYSLSHDGSIKVWRTTNGELIDTMESSALSAQQLLYREDQGWLAAIQQQQGLAFWGNDGNLTEDMAGSVLPPLTAFSLSADGYFLTVIEGDGTIQAFGVAESIAPLTPDKPVDVTPTPTLMQEEGSPEEIESLQEPLPAPVYYLSDASGSSQVWRLDPGGFITTQITFEDNPVTAYDVAQAADHLVFVSGNQLILVNKGGENRRVLVSGEAYAAESPEDAMLKAITAPVFSPDGYRVAYAMNGLHTYFLLSNENTQYRTNVVSESENVVYRPIFYSPGGNNLYVQVEVNQKKSLLVLNAWDGELYAEFKDGSCCQPQLNAEQDAVYFTGEDDYGNAVGLWLVDIWEDTIETILPSAQSANAEFFSAFPIQEPVNGDLLFFYAPRENRESVPLMMAQAADDGVSLLQVIRPDSYAGLTEVLWARDASLALISDPVTGELKLLRANDRAAITLPASGTMLRWGN
jgi:WD40 repeat protein